MYNNHVNLSVKSYYKKYKHYFSTEHEETMYYNITKV